MDETEYRNLMKGLQDEIAEHRAQSTQPNLTEEQLSLSIAYELQIKSILESSRFLYSSLVAADLRLRVTGSTLDTLREDIEVCSKMSFSLECKLMKLQYQLRGEILAGLSLDP